MIEQMVSVSDGGKIRTSWKQRKLIMNVELTSEIRELTVAELDAGIGQSYHSV